MPRPDVPEPVASLKEYVMIRKTACILVLLGTVPVLAQPQQQQPAATRPTKADVQKVVRIISGDKTKVATYCNLARIEDGMARATAAKDSAKLQELGQQAEDMGRALGPEYVALTSGLDEIDPESREGKDLLSGFETLDKLCSGK
jgi:hypothetical protein